MAFEDKTVEYRYNKNFMQSISIQYSKWPFSYIIHVLPPTHDKLISSNYPNVMEQSVKTMRFNLEIPYEAC